MTPAARCLEGAWPPTPALIAVGVVLFVSILLYLAQQELLRDRADDATDEVEVAGYEKVVAFGVILAVVTLVYLFAALYTYKRICSW